MTQLADDHSDGPRFGTRPASASTFEMTVQVVGDDDPARRGDPFLGLTHQPLGDLARIERGVGLADGLDEGVAAVDPGLEGPRTDLEPGGQVRPPGTSGRTGGRVTLFGDRSHRSSEGPGARRHTTGGR